MASTNTTSFIAQAACGNAQGTINFHYKGTGGETMPESPADPLELLGDLTLLHLDRAQRAKLRDVVRKDLEREGAQAVWNSRNFRKNVILSFGQIV